MNDENYLINLVKYIHFNPQNHGIVEDFRDWEFSSWHAYTTNKPTLIAKEFVLKEFGGMDNFLNEHRLVEELEVGG